MMRHNSGEIARSRLKLILVADKTHLSPGFLEQIKTDMVSVLARYMEVDSGQVDLRLIRMEATNTKEMIPVLCASIPIRKGCKNAI